MAATLTRTSGAGDGVIIDRGCYVYSLTLTSDAVGAGVATLQQYDAAGAIIGELRTSAANRSASVKFKGFRVHRRLWLANLANCTVIAEYE